MRYGTKMPAALAGGLVAAILLAGCGAKSGTSAGASISVPAASAPTPGTQATVAAAAPGTTVSGTAINPAEVAAAQATAARVAADVSEINGQLAQTQIGTAESEPGQ